VAFYIAVNIAVHCNGLGFLKVTRVYLEVGGRCGVVMIHVDYILDEDGIFLQFPILYF
jgi:hypothetical protein